MTLQETCLNSRGIAYLEVTDQKQVNYGANVYRLIFCSEGNRAIHKVSLKILKKNGKSLIF